MTIQMTPEEYQEYRGYQKKLEDIKSQEKQKETMIASLRDQYHQEFVQRMQWSKRAIKAEQRLAKLKEIMQSTMHSKLQLDNIRYELEKENSDEQRQN